MKIVSLQKKYGKLWQNKEVMEFLGVSRRVIYEWQKKGVMETVKIGGKVYVPDSEIQRLLKGGKK